MSKSRTNFGMFKGAVKKSQRRLAKPGNQDGNAVVTVPVEFVQGSDTWKKYCKVITDLGLCIAAADIDVGQPMISPAGHPIAGYLTLERYTPTTESVH